MTWFPTDNDTEAPRTCEWCGETFHRRSLRGRPPRYCRPSHRVRACERRRGLLRPGQRPPRAELPPPSDYVGPALGRVEHDQGKTHSTMAWTMHLARPGGLPDAKGRTPSLCGTMVRQAGERPHNSGPVCIHCTRLARLHPVNEHWWSAGTQRVATALVEDMRSLVLAVRQSRTKLRDPLPTLARVDAELTRLAVALGLDPVPEPSLHPRSCAS